MKVTVEFKDSYAKSCIDEIKRMALEQEGQKISDRIAKKYLLECISTLLNHSREYDAYPEDLVGSHYVSY